jgi:hypothetical protein
MSLVATSGPETRTVHPPKPSARMNDIDVLIKRAGEGNRGCLSRSYRPPPGCIGGAIMRESSQFGTP